MDDAIAARYHLVEATGFGHVGHDDRLVLGGVVESFVGFFLRFRADGTSDAISSVEKLSDYVRCYVARGAGDEDKGVEREGEIGVVGLKWHV